MADSYTPTRQDLRKAWTVYKNGGKPKDIWARLGISSKKYANNRSIFASYFERQRKLLQFEKAQRVSTKKARSEGLNCKEGERVLTPDKIDLEILRSYVVCGFNRGKIADLLGVSRTTLYTFAKENPKVQMILDNALQQTAAEIMKDGLLRLCRVHELPDLISSNYLGEIRTKAIKKKFNPNITAIKYVLANTIGWASEPKAVSDDNKGDILKTLDTLMNDDPDVHETKVEENEE
jgi:hypothetical protein